MRTITQKIPILLFLLLSVTVAYPQKIDSFDRGRAKAMLSNVKKEIKNGYFDSNFKGGDLDAVFAAAYEKIDKAQTLGQALASIAQAVVELNDSHTRFYPPETTVSVEYDIRMQMIGDQCLVTKVKPNSDAEGKGLKPGDELIQIESAKPTHNDLWKIIYYYFVLSPRNALTLKVLSPGDKEPHDLRIESKVTKSSAVLSLEALIRRIELGDNAGEVHRFVRLGNTVIWKMPSFVIDPVNVDEIMEKRVNGAENLIIDLRGNGGGYVVALERFAGYFVDKDTKIADLKGRKQLDPQMAKTRGNNTFKGNLIILIDSNSASASEIFSRFMQIQQRAVIMGDISAGAVMQSRTVSMQIGSDNIVPFAMNLTMADVIMTDGKSLEHLGVAPQVHMIPTGAELAKGEDRILASALELFGQKNIRCRRRQAFPA